MVFMEMIVGTLVALVATALLALAGWLVLLTIRFVPIIIRVFQEKPLLFQTIEPPLPDAEEVGFLTDDGISLRGSYLRALVSPRRGLVMFCHGFGSDRWSYRNYCDFLRGEGFDIFTFDFRNHGESQAQAGYAPLQWVTDRERADVQAALHYVKQRLGPGGTPLGLFGVSRGGGAAILAAAGDPDIRCVAADGAFPTHGMVFTYMRRWVGIYSQRPEIYQRVPDWCYASLGHLALWLAERQLGCRFPRLERCLGRLAPRPLLMIQGERDNYIQRPVVESFLANGHGPRELWVVEGAKHLQGIHLAPDAYRDRVLSFFLTHLAQEEPESVELTAGSAMAG